ncbi:unnamed protein product [Durusdinium trenchii]|uniref:Solute carrier family 40 protein n=1 Tax=Durusdinium trenchii TaxID=1381693 RepID=A0ABP0RVK1_9DINO
MSADTDQQPDPDSFSFQEEDFETIPWSVSYVLVCILLPALCGGLSSFAWAGFTLYVRSQGWDLQTAGVLVSVGGLGRLVTQQVLLRLGLWSCVLLASVHLVFATLGLIFVDQAWAVFGEISAMIAFDVTVAVEGVTFEVWSDSEVMCAQAQSTVLSVFTLLVNAFSTLQPWEAYCMMQLVGGVVPPITLLAWLCKCFRSPSSRQFTSHLESFLGVLLRKVSTGLMMQFDHSQAPLPLSRQRMDASHQSQRGRAPLPCPEQWKAAVRDNPRQTMRTWWIRHLCVVQMNWKQRLNADAQAVHILQEWPIAAPLRRSGGSHASSRRPTLRSRLTTRTAHTHHTTESGRTAHTARSGRSNMTRQTAQTSGTLATAMTGLSRLTRLSEAGQAFDFHYGVTNALRPNIASNTVRVSLDGVADEYGKQKSGEGEEEPQAPWRSAARALFLPAFVIMLSSFNNNASYGVEWSTFAIFFKEQHGWESATWAGICQTAGDLLAALIMAVAGKPTRTDLGELSGIRWFWHSLTGQPYNVSCFLLAWVLLNFGMCIPWLPAAIASQIIMGTIYVFAVKASTDMNLFYSLGDSQVFLAMQVLCRNADSLGCVLAGFVAFSLYELEPLGPFLLTGSISVFALVVYTTSMCYRVGFGTDIETAEAQRSRRKGLRRVSTWKSHRSVVNTELEDETA